MLSDRPKRTWPGEGGGVCGGKEAMESGSGWKWVSTDEEENEDFEGGGGEKD